MPVPRARTREARSFAVHVDADLCDGCGICIFFCKPAIFELSSKLSPRGVFPAEVRRGEACNGCGLCDRACPQLAILVAAVGGEQEA